MPERKLLITDLDGSLLNSDSQISAADQQTLTRLGSQNTIRVIATGRNHYSAETVLKQNKDIDYAIISTGIGIIDYKKQEFIKSHYLPQKAVIFLVKFLLKEKVDFMVHNVLPDNHYISCYDAGTGHPDFNLRWKWYRDFASNIDLSKLTDASQLIAFFPHNTPRIAQIRKLLPDFHVIRTTSPINSHYDWMEVFPKDVSKGHALKWLCERLDIDISRTVCLGNDYNDLDMLRLAARSFVTMNAPDDLKAEFPVTVSNNDDPLTEIIRRLDKEQDISG